MKYDAFISYRRGNGFFMAQVIRDHLEKQKVKCFLDVEELSSGKFDNRIIEAIQDAPNFILILTKNALDRCCDEQDWMRREILEALKHSKTIIPVMYEDFKWPKKWDEKIPEPIKTIEHYQAVSGTKVYLSAMIDRIVSYMSGVGTKPQQPQSEVLPPIVDTFHIATSNLTVVDSLMQGWDCKSVFAKHGLSVEEHPYKWSDKILKDLASGKIDLAVYNKESCLCYNSSNDTDIHIVKDVCSSMGGRNFYILASREGKWKDMTLDCFKQSLDSTTIIGVSKSSDMYKNLLYILDMTEEELNGLGVKFMDYHSDQGLQLFDVFPDLLIIGGQDIRFLAERTGKYFELISYDDFPQDKKMFFFRNSINSLLISPSGYEKLNGVDMEQLANELMLNFYKCLLSTKSKREIFDKLANRLSGICEDEDALEYVVNKIVFETYRIL